MHDVSIKKYFIQKIWGNIHNKKKYNWNDNILLFEVS